MSLLTLFILSLAEAAVLQCPNPGVDLKLFEGKTARDFFSKHTEAGPCQKELGAARNTFLHDRKNLEKLNPKKDGAKTIESQWEKVEGSRGKWLQLMNRCGHCAMNEMDIKKIEKPTHNEYWYIADGSCQIPKTEKAVLDQVFETQSSMMLKAGTYRSYEGGFPSTIEFTYVDSNLKNVNKDLLDPKDPFNSFIAVRGPKIGMQWAFGYFYSNKVEKAEELELKTYSHEFTSLPARRSDFPEVFDRLPSGRSRPTKLIGLTQVSGHVFITSDGYMRYCTAADLGMEFGYAKTLAQETLLGTLASLYEKGLGETP